jgi:hypothetical protein
MMKYKHVSTLLLILAVGFIVVQLTALQAQSTTKYEETVTYFEFDLTCQPLCWAGFEPGVSSMADIFEWFGPSYPIYKNNINAPDSVVGGSVYSITVAAYSDATQPTPRLRSYLVRLPFRFLPEPSEFDLTPQEADRWLISTTLTQLGQPSQIGIRFERLNVMLTLDYDEQNALFIYGGAGLSEPMTVCPNLETGGVQLWMYSDQERDGLTMLRDLETYEYHGVFFPEGYRYPDLQVIEDPVVISALINELLQTGCLAQASLPSPISTATPTIAFTPTFTPTETPPPTFTPSPTPIPCPSNSACFTVGDFRAVQYTGDPRAYIERSMAAGIDPFDSPPTDGWTMIGRTNGAGDNGVLQAFTVLNNVPYAALQHPTKGCIVVTPKSLGPRTQGQTRLVDIIEQGNSARCNGDWSGLGG